MFEDQPNVITMSYPGRHPPPQQEYACKKRRLPVPLQDLITNQVRHLDKITPFPLTPCICYANRQESKAQGNV